MEILKTKTEKTEKDNLEVEKMFNEISEKLKIENKVELIFKRDTDFKKKLSTTCGFGFQDMKRKYRTLIQKLIGSYDVKFEQITGLSDKYNLTFIGENFAVKVIIKNNK